MAGAEAPFAYPGLDRVFHERARLGIASSLAGRPDGLGFTELRALCGLTDGNLSRHLAVLEEAGLVALDKVEEGRRAVTRCRLTMCGRERFAAYLDALRDVLGRASRASEATRAAGPAGEPA